MSVSLLLLHDLHPDDLTVRATRAVDAVGPTVRKSGGELRLTAVDPDAATLTVTVTTSGGGCGSTPAALRQTVADALADAVPDAAAIEVVVEEVPEPIPVRLGRKPARAAP